MDTFLKCYNSPTTLLWEERANTLQQERLSQAKKCLERLCGTTFSNTTLKRDSNRIGAAKGLAAIPQALETAFADDIHFHADITVQNCATVNASSSLGLSPNPFFPLFQPVANSEEDDTDLACPLHREHMTSQMTAIFIMHTIGNDTNFSRSEK